MLNLPDVRSVCFDNSAPRMAHGLVVGRLFVRAAFVDEYATGDLGDVPLAGLWIIETGACGVSACASFATALLIADEVSRLADDEQLSAASESGSVRRALPAELIEWIGFAESVDAAGLTPWHYREWLVKRESLEATLQDLSSD
jgi:hypothetical protein